MAPVDHIVNNLFLWAGRADMHGDHTTHTVIYDSTGQFLAYTPISMARCILLPGEYIKSLDGFIAIAHLSESGWMLWSWRYNIVRVLDGIPQRQSIIDGVLPSPDMPASILENLS